MQEEAVGLPMKVKGHRKQRSRESSSSELSSELLAFTTGVSLKPAKTAMTTKARQAPHKDKAVSVMPMVSLYDRNSISLGMHRSFKSLDQ